MSDHRTPAVPDGQPKKTIGELVADLSQKFSTIIRDELKLAQAQLTEKFSVLGKGAGLLAAAGVMALLYLIPTLLYALIHGLAVGLGIGVWAGALIVALILLIIIAVLALLGISSLKKSKKIPADPKKSLTEGLSKGMEAVKKGMQ